MYIVDPWSHILSCMPWKVTIALTFSGRNSRFWIEKKSKSLLPVEIYFQDAVLVPTKENGIYKEGYLTKSPFHSDGNPLYGSKVKSLSVMADFHFCRLGTDQTGFWSKYIPGFPILLLMLLCTCLNRSLI